MFNKKDDDKKSVEPVMPSTIPEARKPESVSEVRRRNISVIGPTLRFKGELSAKEDLVIEGHIEGKIAHQEKNLTIGKQGRVKADIHAKVVDIQGEVEGDVRGDEVVRLKETAVVNGNISSPRVMIEEGAFFTGSIEMTRQDAKRDDAARPGSDAGSPKLKVADAPSSAHAPNGGA